MMYPEQLHKGSAFLSVMFLIVMITALMSHVLYVMNLCTDCSVQRMIAEQYKASARTGLELLVSLVSRQYSQFKGQAREEVIFTAWPVGNGRTVPLAMYVDTHPEGLLLEVRLSNAKKALRMSCILTERSKIGAHGQRLLSYEIIGWQETSAL